MSIYSDISKEIGIMPRHVALPAKSLAKDWLEKVKQGDVEAFKNVFLVYRHAKTPMYEEGIEIINIICEAYKIGCQNPDWK